MGLVGFGAWGSHHARAIASTPTARLVAIAARSPESQAAARAEFPQADVMADYRQLLARDDLEAVAIVLPSHLHFEVASQALAQRKHALLEKPMALSLADCQALIDLARRHDRLLAIGHELRLSSLWGKVKEIISSGGIGEPQYVLVELSRRPYRLGAGGWRFDAARVGSWILEEPIHFFDLARWYLDRCGEPVSLYARANSCQPQRPELHDNFSALVNFAGGAYAVVSQTLAAFEHHQTVKVAGTQGALWAYWSGVIDRTLHPTFGLKHFDGQEVIEIPFSKPTGEVFELLDQAAMFASAVRHGTPLACTGTEGLRAVALCLAAQRSVAEGMPVPLDPA